MSELEMATKIAELEKRITLLESGAVQMTPRASMLLKGGKPLLTTMSFKPICTINYNFSCK